MVTGMKGIKGIDPVKGNLTAVKICQGL